MLQFCSLILLHPLFIVYILNKGERSYNFFPLDGLFPSLLRKGQ